MCLSTDPILLIVHSRKTLFVNPIASRMLLSINSECNISIGSISYEFNARYSHFNSSGKVSFIKKQIPTEYRVKSHKIILDWISFICLQIGFEKYQMFATHVQLVLPRISGFRFGLFQSLRFLPLKVRELWFWDWVIWSIRVFYG